jgi:hypothetical protein
LALASRSMRNLSFSQVKNSTSSNPFLLKDLSEGFIELRAKVFPNSGSREPSMAG